MDFLSLVPIIKQLIISLPILFFSVILHECGHGLVAEKCGDPTARMLGRITLNPIPHIDLFGTIIIPLILVISGSSVLFGWAKPVPVNFFNLRHPKRDMIWVSMGGIGVNILLAFIGIIGLLILNQVPTSLVHSQGIAVVSQLFIYLFFINILLATFNLIPIPPLDGSRIVMGILPSPYAEKYAKLEPFGIIIVFVLLYLGVFHTILQLVLRVVKLIFPVLF
ncbi:MAG: site-2 protease family protein [bacterium]|nr:site-2 protease family protein [bacterium]